MGQFITPDSLPPTTFCRRLLIPNDPKWIGTISGALLPLMYSSEWVQVEGISTEAAAARCAEMMEAYWNSSCEGETVEFRFTEECGMEYSNDGETWIPVAGWSSFAEDCFKGEQGEAGATGATGAIGATGATGATGEQGEKGDCCGVDDFPTPETSSGNENFCGTAEYFTQWHNEKWTDVFQAIIAAADATHAIADAVESIPGVGLILAPFCADVHLIADLGSTVAEAYMAEADTAFIEAAKCKLYCKEKAAGFCDPALVIEWATEGVAEFDNPLTLGRHSWYSYILYYTEAEIGKRIYIGSAQPLDNCDELCLDCPDAEECPIDWTFYEPTTVLSHVGNVWTVQLDGTAHFSFTSGDNTQGCYLRISPSVPFWSGWALGSMSPTGNYNTLVNPIWNYDTFEYPSGQIVTLEFSTIPF